MVRREFHGSSYYRCFSLPENADEDAIEANLDKCIRKIIIPKKEIKKKVKKEIEIK